jgi:pimeloyl-ACP methyl ester carboxylesterase
MRAMSCHWGGPYRRRGVEIASSRRCSKSARTLFGFPFIFDGPLVMKTPAWALFATAAIFVVLQSASASGDEQVVVAKNGDARLRVFSEGAGPAIVLLPGQGRGPRDLDAVSAALVSAGYRVVRPEPRGFGESVGPIDGADLRDIAADVAAAIEVTHSAPAIVGGWAYGNRVARMLATERPRLVRGLVLIAAGGRFPPAPGVFESLRDVQNQSLPIEKRAEIARRISYGPNTNISIADMRLDDRSAATTKAQSLAPSPSTPVESWWAGGKAPMLVLQGLHDVIAPPQNGRSLKQDYPDRVTLVEFADLGHSMVRERPDLVANAIVSWMAKLSQ